MKVHHYEPLGSCNGYKAIIVDDIIDTAGTVVAATNMLLSKGAKSVYVSATHGIFSGPAIDRLRESPVEEVIVTNTLQVENKGLEKLRVVSIAPLIAEAIKRAHEGESISSLFI